MAKKHPYWKNTLIKLLHKLEPPPAGVPSEIADLEPGSLSADQKDVHTTRSKEEIDFVKRVGISMRRMENVIQGATQVNFERLILYKEIDRSIVHWLMGGACFAGDTKIRLCSGESVSILEIVKSISTL